MGKSFLKLASAHHFIFNWKLSQEEVKGFPTAQMVPYQGKSSLPRRFFPAGKNSPPEVFAKRESVFYQEKCSLSGKVFPIRESLPGQEKSSMSWKLALSGEVFPFRKKDFLPNKCFPIREILPWKTFPDRERPLWKILPSFLPVKLNWSFIMCDSSNTLLLIQTTEGNWCDLCVINETMNNRRVSIEWFFRSSSYPNYYFWSTMAFCFTKKRHLRACLSLSNLIVCFQLGPRSKSKS